eukprot:TRINITY_DN3447_c0_g1_i1.p1 TRINITY_DN3447_c0_g1~~TRINITY_DN3447_c0_g1_i1.p1  ORF type:complete len:314 (-),score=44.21 TRINITY_DN3447_c0_g1_i1:14-955(-)
MLQRFLRWCIFPTHANQEIHYQCVDLEPENILSAHTLLLQLGKDQGFEVNDTTNDTETLKHIKTLHIPSINLFITLQPVDIYDFVRHTVRKPNLVHSPFTPLYSRVSSPVLTSIQIKPITYITHTHPIVKMSNDANQTWDFLLSCAFLDLFNVPVILEKLFTLLTPSGHFYFPINFDGATHFQPIIEKAFDKEIEDIYHASMSGDSLSGGSIFVHLRSLNASIITSGSSSWIVRPIAEKTEDGGIEYTYPAQEQYFTRTILHFVHKEYHAAISDDEKLKQFDDWFDTRLSQLYDTKELIYIAHQTDVFGQLIE